MAVAEVAGPRAEGRVPRRIPLAKARYYRALRRLGAEGRPGTTKAIAEMEKVRRHTAWYALEWLKQHGLVQQTRQQARTYHDSGTYHCVDGFFVDKDGVVYRPCILPEDDREAAA